jgi:hypothetical protein
MTTVDVLFRYATPPSDQVAMALGRARDVYGIRGLAIDSAARTVRVEFDATRLNGSSVRRLLAASGLDIVEELPLVAPPEPVAAA